MSHHTSAVTVGLRITAGTKQLRSTFISSSSFGRLLRLPLPPETSHYLTLPFISHSINNRRGLRLCFNCSMLLIWSFWSTALLNFCAHSCLIFSHHFCRSICLPFPRAPEARNMQRVFTCSRWDMYGTPARNEYLLRTQKNLMCFINHWCLFTIHALSVVLLASIMNYSKSHCDCWMLHFYLHLTDADIIPLMCESLWREQVLFDATSQDTSEQVK